jgi:hypothetical protein
MSHDTLSSQADRFSLVESFYGPGHIISWLCILASIFITWCFNPEYRCKDNISTDFIFALAVPSVAAGHVIYMVFFSSPDRRVTIQQLFTSTEGEIVQRAAAAEAALNVCETFAAAAVWLVFISMLHVHLKRTLAVLIVGLLSFATEAVVFVQTRDLDVSASNLSPAVSFQLLRSHGLHTGISGRLAFSLRHLDVMAVYTPN